MPPTICSNRKARTAPSAATPHSFDDVSVTRNYAEHPLDEQLLAWLRESSVAAVPPPRSPHPPPAPLVVAARRLTARVGVGRGWRARAGWAVLAVALLALLAAAP